MTDEKVKEAAVELVEGTTTVGAAVVGTLATFGSIGTAALAAGPLLIAAGVKGALQWRQKSIDRFWEKLVHGAHDDGVTAEEIAGQVQAHVDEPYVQETIWRSVRTVLDAVDPAVAVPLAVLARACLRDKAPPDGFTRSAMRLLTELGRDELEDLARLVGWIVHETKTQDVVTLMAKEYLKVSKNEWPQIPWEVKMLRDDFVGKHPGKDEDPYHQLLGLKAPPRLFYLLRANGLGEAKSGVSFAAGPNTVVLERAVAERLRVTCRLAE